ncbi:hypothetical protein P879_00054 [Paragonimus westermani]|uniref:Uncharacterized protein n=1 Tax=Paragonimus westermani TaxID=34504 RepID=A0A8T0DXT2_9TREM|nr:hypothetical protein P879_00054 [Paragonimus westermani]
MATLSAFDPSSEPQWCRVQGKPSQSVQLMPDEAHGYPLSVKPSMAAISVLESSLEKVEFPGPDLYYSHLSTVQPHANLLPDDSSNETSNLDSGDVNFDAQYSQRSKTITFTDPIPIPPTFNRSENGQVIGMSGLHVLDPITPFHSHPKSAKSSSQFFPFPLKLESCVFQRTSLDLSTSSVRSASPIDILRTECDRHNQELAYSRRSPSPTQLHSGVEYGLDSIRPKSSEQNSMGSPQSFPNFKTSMKQSQTDEISYLIEPPHISRSADMFSAPFSSIESSLPCTTAAIETSVSYFGSSAMPNFSSVGLVSSLSSTGLNGLFNIDRCTPTVSDTVGLPHYANNFNYSSPEKSELNPLHFMLHSGPDGPGKLISGFDADPHFALPPNSFSLGLSMMSGGQISYANPSTTPPNGVSPFPLRLPGLPLFPGSTPRSSQTVSTGPSTLHSSGQFVYPFASNVGLCDDEYGVDTETTHGGRIDVFFVSTLHLTGFIYHRAEMTMSLDW